MNKAIFLDRDGTLIEEVETDNKCIDHPATRIRLVGGFQNFGSRFLNRRACQ